MTASKGVVVDDEAPLEPDPPVVALQTYHEPDRGLAIAADPVEMIALASKMAAALVDVVEKKRLYANISGKKYPQVEAWLTIARMDNVVAREHDKPERLIDEDGTVYYEAVVDLIRLSDGMIVGQGSAICGTKDDSPWNTRSSTAKRGMAVTRATSRACRQHYAWIMAMAGYQPTPAEEMGPEATTAPESGRGDPQAAQAPRNVTPAAAPAPGPSEAGTYRLVISEAPEDAVRIVRKPEKWEGERPKIELVGKIGNRKHTAVILGPLAEATVAAIGRGEIAIGTVVELEGAVLEEFIWQEGKPPKKELWGVDDGLMRDVRIGESSGAWRSVARAAAPAAPAAPAAEAPRMAGEPGTWTTLRARVDVIEYRPFRDTEILVLTAAELDTGEKILAALAEDIEGQVGPPGELEVGTIVQMYGEWKAGGRFIIDTIGRPTAAATAKDDLAASLGDDV